MQDGATRILNVLPSDPDTPLECSLLQVHLGATASPFEALSYTWGDQSDRPYITCDGILFPVTNSLFDALKALRLPDRARSIWIDAICINQEDIDEKNVQLRLMASIYEIASQVLIWLGEEEEDTLPAMELLSKLVKGSKLDQDQAGLRENVMLAGMPPPDNAAWKLLSRFLKRPWFSRVWVVQEAVLARRAVITCGSQQVGWDDLCTAAEAIDMIHYGPVVDWEHLRIMSLQRYHAGRVGKDLGLLRLLLVERTQSATDDRDKVFGLLGLATDVGIEQGDQGTCLPVRANYHLKTSEVYTEVARSIITSYDSLSILTAAGLLRKPVMHDLPSWVPDWSRRQPRKALMSRQGESNYKACNGSPARCKISTDGLRLTVSGILCDRISRIGRPLDVEVDSTRVLLEWIKLAEDEILDPEQLIVPDKLFTFRRTIVANRSLMGDGPPTDFELSAFFEWFRTRMKAAGQDLPRSVFRSPDGLDVETESGCAHFNSLVQEACNSRCFFLTEKALMGIGPPATVPGDMVCVARGACPPLVLREVDVANEDGGNSAGRQPRKVVLVGDAYVDGLAYGEAYDETILQEFELR